MEQGSNLSVLVLLTGGNTGVSIRSMIHSTSYPFQKVPALSGTSQNSKYYVLGRDFGERKTLPKGIPFESVQGRALLRGMYHLVNFQLKSNPDIVHCNNI